MTDSEVTYGTPVPWYRLNGWIAASGGPDWMRHDLVLLGVTLLHAPWLYIGPLDREPDGPPQELPRRRWL